MGHKGKQNSPGCRDSRFTFYYISLPDVTPQNAASHLGLFCLLREFFIEKLNKIEKSLLTPLKMKVDSSS